MESTARISTASVVRVSARARSRASARFPDAVAPMTTSIWLSRRAPAMFFYPARFAANVRAKAIELVIANSEGSGTYDRSAGLPRLARALFFLPSIGRYLVQKHQT